MLKKIFSLFLIVVFMMSTASISVLAGYEDGAECWCCGHYHYDDYMCDCGACSEDCTNSDCYEQSHCAECGTCLINVDPDWCADCLCCEDCYVDNFYHCLYCGQCISTGDDVCDNCGACEDCYLQHETHCLYCNDCFMGSEDEDLCSACFICASCSGDDICGHCGLCEECAWAADKHCLECGNCFENVPECEEFGEHCEECCNRCENCERCLFYEDVEICDECGFCMECCRDVADSLSCSCGEYCVLSGDWEEHICPDCETPFCSVEQCEYCGKCLDCCESNSNCSDGMCEEDIDYDEHFCEDCGECFHNVTQCEHCANNNEYRCEDCCEELSENSGSHTANPKSAWAYSETHHYHECKYCNKYEHYTGAQKHTFNSQGICTVCSYNNGTSGIITEHPKNQIACVTDVLSEGLESPLSLMNNKVTFSIKAKDAVSYQWYAKCDGGNWYALKDEMIEDDDFGTFPYIEGAKTDTVKFTVPSDGCIFDYVYKCVVVGKDGKEYTSNSAQLIIKHAFSDTFATSVTGKYIGEFTYANGLHFALYESPGHKYPCLGEACDLYKSEEVEPHQYSDKAEVLTDKDGVKWNQYHCEICGRNYTVKQSEDTIAEEIKKAEEKIVDIKIIEITGLDAPKVGAKPDYSATISPSECHFKEYSNEYYENGISWYDLTDKADVTVKTGTYKEGHNYRVKIHITCPAGYKFDESITAKVSGNDASVVSTSNQMTITLTYKSKDGGYKASLPTVVPETKPDNEQNTEKTEEQSKESIKESYNSKGDSKADSPSNNKESTNHNGEGKGFSDVPKDAYYYDAVEWASESGITSGTDATHFSPDAVCTRAQVVTFLHRMVASPEPAAIDNPFSDVKGSSYYYKPVMWAYGSEITGGTSQNTFSPDANCTRAQVVTFLWRAAGKPEANGNNNPFNDVKAGSYYEKAVLWAVENGITGGTSKNTFSPEANCTRAQVVTFLYRFIGK